ncbi:MAG: winged helix-turn-helix domain-containing protein [Deltaproteobacteria bacterium]|nr:winged helix-turn-helix domain-containing protein [Deltaproteobacteria bacterium]
MFVSKLSAGVIFLMMSHGRYTAEELADLYGIGADTVYGDINMVRTPELAASKGEWGGGRNRLMTFEEGTEFLDEWAEKATEGLIVTMPELRDAYNKAAGRVTPRSAFYRLLKRHNWRKVLPDTRHPEGDPLLQEEFKKKLCRRSWKKLS